MFARPVLLLLVASRSLAAATEVTYDYQVFTARKSFSDAQRICQHDFQGNLASVADAAELQTLRNLVGIDNFWVGGERIPGQARTPENWQWTDGSNFDNANIGPLWQNKEPNDRRGREACIVAKDNGGGASLNDARCEYAFQSVCKRVHIPNPLLADGFHKRAETNCWYKYYNHVVNKVETNGHRRNWWDAQGFCRADTPLSGGNLVSISDQAEQDWIKDLIQITYQEWTWRPIWIGLNGVWSDEDQQWSDGSAVSYTNWMANEPNNMMHNSVGEEHCAQMSHSKDNDHRDFEEDQDPNARPENFGEWNDAACERTRGWICEICTDEW